MHVTHLRPRYAETDQAGVVYHSNYLEWFEVGRTTMLRESGCSYAELERSEGIVLPVTEASLRFVRPAHYDELVRIETRVEDLRRVRFRIGTRIFRDEDQTLLCEGSLWLACLRRSDQKLVPLPKKLHDVLGRDREADAASSDASPGA